MGGLRKTANGATLTAFELYVCTLYQAYVPHCTHIAQLLSINYTVYSVQCSGDVM